MTKNIVVVTSAVPFYYGGNERLAENLAKSLRDAGHNACHFFTSRNSYDSFGKLIGGYIANRFTDLDSYPWKNRIDQIISISYPSYAVKHNNHVCWLAHRMREYYDLWPRWIETKKRPLSRLKTRAQRAILHTIDDYYLGKIDNLYCISDSVRERLDKWGGHSAVTLHPPPEDDSNHSATIYKPYIFAISRLTSLKRFHLLIEAASNVKSDVSFVIAGEGEERENLERLTQRLNLSSKVQFLGAISEEEKHRRIIESRGVFFAPYHEEYGIVTVEAMKRSKPVITAVDSGGPLDFIKNGENGFIIKPDSNAAAAAIDELGFDESLAKKMGSAARKTVKDITWENVVKKLVI